MAAIQKGKVNSKQKEAVLTLKTKRKTPSLNQYLDIKAAYASGQKKEAPKIQELKRESRPNEQSKSREEVKLQTLKDITKSQHEKITSLERQLAEAVEALLREREEKRELCLKVSQQNKAIAGKEVARVYFKREMEQNKRDKEDAIALFSKAELDKEDLSAMLRSVRKEGCTINRKLRAEKNKNEKKTRELEEAQTKADNLQNKADDLQSKADILQIEVSGLYDAAFTLRKKVGSLQSEKAKLQDMNFAQEVNANVFQKLYMEDERQLLSIKVERAEEKEALESKVLTLESKIKNLRNYKLSAKEYKKSFKEATALVEKTKQEKKTVLQRLRAYKARSDRRGKIIQADKETKAEMKETIDRLQQENERLKAKLESLNSGFIGRYRSMRRCLGRVVNNVLSRF